MLKCFLVKIKRLALGLFILFIIRGELEAFLIGNEGKVSFANLTSVPRFLRLNDVKLFYNRGQMSIEEKCRSIENYSQPFKEALKDSNLIYFFGDVARNDLKQFDDHSKFLNYLSETFLKIFNSSREYKFSIAFYPEEAGAGANVLNSIIQMPQICRCSNLRFWLWKAPQPLLLPVEAISSWLNRSIGDVMHFNGRTPQEIFLRIYVSRIQNVVEMCEHLAKVCLFYYKVLKIFNFYSFCGKIYHIIILVKLKIRKFRHLEKR